MDYDYDALKAKIKRLYPDSYQIILLAFEFAKKAHAGKKRISDDEYFTHPCAVADILLDFGSDAPMIMAALLHDVLEDTDCSEQQLTAIFGTEVVELVNGVTKFDKYDYATYAEQRAENIRKMFFAMSKDLRVLLIKLADRLHNMRTLDVRTPEKQKEISRETLEIYAALAGRLGISFFKCELEDLSMKYLYPDDYAMIVGYLTETRESRGKSVAKITAILEDKLKEMNIKGEVSGRIKHIYSIYKKLKQPGIDDIASIYDISAVRIIVDTLDECYTMLGTVHKMWKPLPDRIKDYITMPKPNNYQSLHTTVITENGETFEIQIRTHEMHKVAEYGLAAHYKYKERTLGAETDLDKQVLWIREVLDSQSAVANPQDFLELLKIDVFKEEVFLFTPRGDVFSLPDGSTAIDFAYRIHSEIGNKCVGVKINKKIMPLNTVLKTGDIVEIITNNSSKGPSRDWLKIVKTNSARQKIKQYFKREMHDENVARGKEMLEHEAKKRGSTFASMVTKGWLDYISEKYQYNSPDDIFEAVGFGEFTTTQVFSKLLEYMKDDSNISEDILAKIEQRSKKPRSANSGVLVNGDSFIASKLAHCCMPVWGDPIVGYITQGHGVTIHRADCPELKGLPREKLVSYVEWDTNLREKFVANIKVFAENRSGLLASVTTCISNKHIEIVGASLRVDSTKGVAKISLQVEVKNLAELSDIINKIKSMPQIIDVRR